MTLEDFEDNLRTIRDQTSVPEWAGNSADVLAGIAALRARAERAEAEAGLMRATLAGATWVGYPGPHYIVQPATRDAALRPGVGDLAATVIAAAESFHRTGEPRPLHIAVDALRRAQEAGA